ncbi:ABC transporter ATP-binding protein [Noviherbaspirillum denitrificans]|uniref:Cobalamin ABC transporter ATP-binding protein n=1 Tax=Noviherbaspirillum denitrificans TaxID=1968433 RepID=A0A254TH28_9BURK|nr:ABC transporter ATP-binding protein [Noviherbaspirillum denitrificans]OWW19843.1 cobalamin ABC transporter ATP-binding protein [Noviherbaspirillum denitrificans]
MQTRDLGLSAGGRVLVDGLNWTVEAGQCWCVIGRNGAGKSTLLRALAGLRAPEKGSVHMDGRPIADWPLAALARERSYLPQGRNDAFGYRAIDTVLAARHPYQDDRYWDVESDYRIAHAALRALDVGHLAERDVRTLSGGERQRVAIAAVLSQETPLMLLDEPASALDLAHQVGVMDLLAKLCRSERKAVVLVSHDLNLSHSVSTHALLLMGDGEWQAGPAAEVMTAPVLSRCLGYPIEAVRHGRRTIFIPAEEGTHD